MTRFFLSRKRFHLMASHTPTDISLCSVNLVVKKKKKKVTISDFATRVELTPLASCDRMIHYSWSTEALWLLTTLLVCDGLSFALVSWGYFLIVTTQSKPTGSLIPNNLPMLKIQKDNFLYFNVIENIFLLLLQAKDISHCIQNGNHLQYGFKPHGSK